jgi:hypothetical protein
MVTELCPLIEKLKICGFHALASVTLFQKNEKCVILAISCTLLHVLITLKLYFMKKLISVLKNEELS